MEIKDFSIEGPRLLIPRVFEDARGYFLESYNHKKFVSNIGIEIDFIQDNESKSSFGALRGLHFQRPPFAQAKLVRVVEGSVLDIVVDIRSKSPTFGQHLAIELSAKNKHQLFVPHGFAHGFVVLSDQAIFQYKVDNYYSPEHDSGILWCDEQLNVDWQIQKQHVVLSKKDTSLQSFTTYSQNPVF